jgi:hypothetical protein
MKAAAAFLATALLLLPVGARAADLPVSYTVEAKPLKAAIAGTMLSFELYSDSACTTLVQSVPVAVENVSLLVALKQVTPKNDTKLPNTVELRTTLAGVTPASSLYLKVTDGGGAVVPVAGACQAQTAGVAGPPGAPGAAATSQAVLVAGTDQSTANNDFIGPWGNSSGFVRNSIVMPFNGTITRVAFSARDALVPAGGFVALTVYQAATANSVGPLNGSTATTLSCTISGPSVGGWCISATPLVVNAGDLISGRLTTSSGSLSNGVSWSVVLSPQ